MDNILWSMAILLMVLSRPAVAVPSCSTLGGIVAPCLSFLKGKDPSKACCDGAKELKDIAKTKADRVAICNCGKQYLVKLKDYDPKRLPLLPKKCGLDFNLPRIDKHTDCNKIEYEVY